MALSPIRITGSVGYNGRNNRPDVIAVQTRLNALKAARLKPLVVDGRVGGKTNGMIAEFQRKVVPLRNPDSRVDPGGKTLKAMNAPGAAAKWGGTPVPRGIPGFSSEIPGLGNYVPVTPTAPAAGSTKSGTYWVTWANTHAKNSNKLSDLDAGFKADVDAFVKALKDGGATVSVSSTKRHTNRAYLFHWSWKIHKDKCKPEDATPRSGVPIIWDHGDLAQSKAGALAMVTGFNLSVTSIYAPSLTSVHISGKAVDMDISWTGKITVKKKDGTDVELTYMSVVKNNTALHTVGSSYGVKKLLSDPPHWSHNGK